MHRYFQVYSEFQWEAPLFSDQLQLTFAVSGNFSVQRYAYITFFFGIAVKLVSIYWNELLNGNSTCTKAEWYIFPKMPFKCVTSYIKLYFY